MYQTHCCKTQWRVNLHRLGLLSYKCIPQKAKTKFQDPLLLISSSALSNTLGQPTRYHTVVIPCMHPQFQDLFLTSSTATAVEEPVQKEHTLIFCTFSLNYLISCLNPQWPAKNVVWASKAARFLYVAHGHCAPHYIWYILLQHRPV